MSGYENCAHDYLENGWDPLPLLNAGKGVVPPGFTGYFGRAVTEDDVRVWARAHADSNIVLHLPDNVVGIDVDNYEHTDSVGNVTLAAGEAAKSLTALVAKHGELPATLRVSARFGEDYDGVSGIRVFRLPEEFAARARERMWLAGPEKMPGIDTIRFGHRQMVVWPSVHSTRATKYRYMDEESGDLVPGVLPPPSSLPLLPVPWCEALLKPPAPKRTRQTARSSSSRPTGAGPGEWWTSGDPCRAVQERLLSALEQMPNRRYDTMVREMLALTRLGEQGHQGVSAAIDTLRGAYLEQVGADRDAEAEWDRAAGGIAAEFERQGWTPEEDKGCCGEVVDPLADLEDAVFTGTETLQRIRQGARARLASPWGVLGDVLARVASETPPTVQLPPVVGSAASLNVGVGLVGPSGGGKGIAHDVGDDLFGWEFAHQIGPGTGEGIIPTFLVWDKDSQDYLMADNRCSLLYADEIAQIGATQARNGATLGSIIRSTWSGKAVSTTNADRTRRRHLSAHSYRLAIVAGVQPELSSILLDDADAGTPQRWLWLPVIDPSMPDTEPDWPGPIPRRSDDHGNGFDVQPGEDPFSWTGVLDVAHSFQSFIKDEHRKRQRGDQGGLDGHMLLTRLKVAGLLALLHETGSIDKRWWDLACLVVEASQRTRRLCQEAVARGMAQQNVDRGRADERRATGARLERAEQNEKLARLLFKTVSNGAHPNAKHQPVAGCTRRCLTHALRRHPAADADDVIQTALRLCWIEEDEDRRWRPGDSQPA